MTQSENVVRWRTGLYHVGMADRGIEEEKQIPGLVPSISRSPIKDVICKKSFEVVSSTGINFLQLSFPPPLLLQPTSKFLARLICF